MNQLTER